MYYNWYIIYIITILWFFKVKTWNKSNLSFVDYCLKVFLLLIFWMLFRHYFRTQHCFILLCIHLRPLGSFLFTTFFFYYYCSIWRLNVFWMIMGKLLEFVEIFLLLWFTSSKYNAYWKGILWHFIILEEVILLFYRKGKRRKIRKRTV